MAAPGTVYTLTLLHKAIIARDVIELRFTKPADLVFQAGQFLQFHIPTAQGVVLRSYSIASSSAVSHLDFCVKLLPGGVASAFFDHLEPGETALAEGPQGHFICKQEHSPHKIFIATGTGLAPMAGMLEDMMTRSIPDAMLELVFGVRSEEDLFWADRLERLAAENPHFTYTITLSRPDQPTAWTGATGRVTEHIPQHHLEAEYYLCGSLEMVKDVRKILVEKGVPTKHIHFEIF